MKSQPYFTSYIKINSKWIGNLKVTAKITKLLGKKVRVNLSDFGFGYGFLDMTLNSVSNKNKK